ncbi:hypothetical protein Mapa_014571 [Marchantia paleacea]|nr:hypothetical protein Mapa_014571 [Marchantia paleacea]
MYRTRAAVLLICIVFLATSNVVIGVDIMAFHSEKACSGSGLSFYDVDPHHCVSFDPEMGSILFPNLASCEKALVFRRGSCDEQVASGSGPSCFIGGAISGGKYKDNKCSRRRNLLSDSADRPCVKTRPTGVVYTEDYTRGTWVLPTHNATQIFSYLAGIPTVEKKNWLESQGAHLKLAVEGTPSAREIRI